MNKLQRLATAVFATTLASTLFAQTTVQPRVPKLVPDIVSAPTATTNTTTPRAIAPSQPVNGKMYTFAGRELLAKFALTGEWVVGNNTMTTGGTTTHLVPRGQSNASYNQRIAVQELPTWVNPVRLGKEYLKDIMDDCAAGTLKPLEKGNVSQFPAEIVFLECIDSKAQTVKVVYAALIQGLRSHLVFSMLSLLPLRSPNAAFVAQSELATFKQLLATLFVCIPNAPKLCE